MQCDQENQFLETLRNKGTRKLLLRENGRSTVNKNSYIIQRKEEKKIQFKNKRKR